MFTLYGKFTYLNGIYYLTSTNLKLIIWFDKTFINVPIVDYYFNKNVKVTATWAQLDEELMVSKIELIETNNSSMDLNNLEFVLNGRLVYLNHVYYLTDTLSNQTYPLHFSSVLFCTFQYYVNKKVQITGMWSNQKIFIIVSNVVLDEDNNPLESKDKEFNRFNIELE